MLRDRLKWLLFPGLNLHARLRGRLLPRYFGVANGTARHVLDAGCGNGMLAYQSYLRGNHVLGISIKTGEIERNRRLFNVQKGIPEERLAFRVMNLYDLPSLGQRFDEIICTEVLEHIAEDGKVCRSFFEALRPGGVLHLCCPNADHPYHQHYHLDDDESGGHVRPGYSRKSYQDLLEPIGFHIEQMVGLGGPIRQAINCRITGTQEKIGFAAGMGLFLATWPFHNLDLGQPTVPYSLYVKAVRPREVTADVDELQV